MALTTQVQALTTEVSGFKKAKTGGGNGGPQKEGKRRTKGVPAWMSKPPVEGEAKTKKVDGRTYNWCEGYGTHEPCWVIHTVDKCCGYIKRLNEPGGNQNEEQEQEGDSPPRSESTRETQRVGWSTTMLAQLSQESDEDDK